LYKEAEMTSKAQSPDKMIYQIYLEADADYVTMKWNGYANSRQFREGTEKMLSELVRHKVNKVLGDIKDMVLINSDDQQWLLDHFLPEAIEAGFRAIALVRPVYYFNKVAVEAVAYKVNHEKLKIQFFNDVRSAREWLQQVEP
jgi:hypothetical protein